MGRVRGDKGGSREGVKEKGEAKMSTLVEGGKQKTEEFQVWGRVG